MFSRRKQHLPEVILRYRKQKPLGYSALWESADAGRETTVKWLAAWKEQLVFFGESELLFAVEWADFARAKWDEETRSLTLVFVDSAKPSLVFQLPLEYSASLLTVIRERITASIVCQVVRELPNGGKVYGQVRRNADDTLFTQITTENPGMEVDRLYVDQVEAELRDTVGL